MNSSKHLIVGALITVGLIAVATSPTHAQPVPVDSINSIADCVFRGYTSDNVTHAFTLNGSANATVQYGAPVIKVTVKGNNGTADSTEQRTYHHMLTQNPNLFGSAEYYLDIYKDVQSVSAGTGGVSIIEKNAARIVFNTSSLPTTFNVGDVYIDQNASAAKKYWIVASVNDTGILGQYIAWVNNNAKDGRCQFTDSASSYRAINSNGKTASIIKKSPGGSGDGTYYLVARGNFNKFNGLQNVTGSIYRNGNNYFIANDSGKVLGTFNVGAGNDWQSADGTIDSFSSPNPIISNSESVNHLKLPSDSGSAILINFAPALTDPPDVSGQDKNATVELLLDNEHGPFINKELVDITDVGHAMTYNQSSPNQGLKNDAFVLEQKDLDELYGAGNAPVPHQAALIDTIVVCAHKKLDKSSPNPYTSGSVKLKLTDANHNFSESPGDLKKIKDQGSGVFDWTSKQSPLTIPAAKGPQTCGTGEEISVAGQIGAGLGVSVKGIGDLILDALGAVGRLIQNFIIYIVSWAIGVASNNIPI